MERDIVLREKHPDVGYITNALWLPKRHVSELSIRAALEKWLVVGKKPVYRKLYRETATHLIVPRMYIDPIAYERQSFPIVDLRPKTFPKVGFQFRSQLAYQDARQEAAARAFLSSDNGIFNLGTGRGKTVISHVKMAVVDAPTLITVPSATLVDQWKKSLLEFMLLDKNDIGIIKADKFQWDRPVVIASLSTLAARVASQDIPLGFESHFGLGIFDEVHHMAGEFFIIPADLLWGLRYGQSATVGMRTDGLDYLYQLHLGKVFHKDTEVDVKPTGFFYGTQIAPLTEEERTEATRGEKRTKEGDVIEEGELHRGLLYKILARRYDFVEQRVRLLKWLWKRGRKVVAVSSSVDVLEAIHAWLPGSAIITEDRVPKYWERNPILRSHQMTLGSTSILVEGIDDVYLDTIVALTPYSSEIWFDQGIGRTGRAGVPPIPGKTNEFYICEDRAIGELVGTCQKMRGHFRARKYQFFFREIKDLEP